MPIYKSTEYGNIQISLDAIASLAGGTISECYGIVGMASQKLLKDGLAELLGLENYSKGIVVRQNDEGLVLDLYIIALQGIKLSEVIYEAQKRVKYVLEKTLEVKCNTINIWVQGVRLSK
ncbi:Asp23/Gls24 family envelope stress response protein [uncultured Dubosiella sp.]|uniref:Asp23/Gls24 family envelope stress response protein n=1 Tax=uncultured Dubosiella sp. TaxID=1937011 RepID=UPI000ED340FB|nr:Asp23/Gls24 family envelope stress response protein [uncultured Dubosiella sp.]GJM58344.1 Asp23/Gls24 family envelope stress response protein [Erysipelotrichaceae bacterium OPF54]HAM29804.1 Asp23/Gls24 family envelope stress response protein [Erysipelotrichaceae bacterium]